MLNAPGTGGLNLGTRLSGAWGFPKLTPCTATGSAPSDLSSIAASLRPRNAFALSGNASSRVIRDSASWLPRTMNVRTPASSSRRRRSARNSAVFIDVWSPS